MSIDALISEVRDRVLSSGITKRDLAARAGLHVNTMIGIDKPGWNPTVETIRKLERAIPVTSN